MQHPAGSAPDAPGGGARHMWWERVRASLSSRCTAPITHVRSAALAHFFARHSMQPLAPSLQLAVVNAAARGRHRGECRPCRAPASRHAPPYLPPSGSTSSTATEAQAPSDRILLACKRGEGGYGGKKRCKPLNNGAWADAAPIRVTKRWQLLCSTLTCVFPLPDAP